jgi:uncharacterized glyoxalase superfamily protein PhnB
MTEAPGGTSIIPSVWVDEIEPVRDFYIEKLGFSHMMGVVGRDGKLDTAIVQKDAAMIMLGRPQEPVSGSALDPKARRSVDLYIYVADVDGFHADVVRRGVRVYEPLTTQWWGDRNFQVKDPAGYALWICQTVQEFVPPAGVTVV